jgi:hypothetical protein
LNIGPAVGRVDSSDCSLLAPLTADTATEILLPFLVLFGPAFALDAAGVLRVESRGASCLGVFREDGRAGISVGVLRLDRRGGKGAPPKLKLNVAFFISRGLAKC